MQQISKINVGYLMHLVGYLYEAYHDARSLEHKVFPPSSAIIYNHYQLWLAVA